MSAPVDWLYHRKNCITCLRARDYLAEAQVKATEETNAAKERRGPKEALALSKTVSKIVVTKGKKVVTFDMKKDPPSDEVLLAHLIGPSGWLRPYAAQRQNANRRLYRGSIRCGPGEMTSEIIWTQDRCGTGG